MRLALAGNPNSGKTTMYNALTGKNETVGNWAGVTVDKIEHTVRKRYAGNRRIIAVDLPGTYSISPFTSEEGITSAYIKNESPDVIINIIDASNLSRSLFFTTQLLELGIPVVVALNKSDINQRKHTVIDTKLLSEKLGCPVVETVSLSSRGLSELIKTAVSVCSKGQIAPYSDSKETIGSKAEAEEADRQRFEFVNGIVASVEKRVVLTRNKNFQDKIDALLTNRWLGIPIFAAVMFLVFQISQVWIGPYIADTFVAWLEGLQGYIGSLFENASPFIYALLVDGVIGGVIAVIGFLPLVMIMYFLIALLEDCGYMARVSVVLDPIFKKVGLSGRSVIPFVISIGCAVPGVMASRTIRNERERRATAMLAPFMPCGAKIPVITLFAGTFFDNAGWVSTVMYFSGIFIIFIGALLVNAITGNRAKKSYFIIELPEYKLPSLWRAFVSMLGRGWSYIVKAATVILLCNTAVQIMQSFNWQLETVEIGAESTSILATIAQPFAYILIPVIGYFSWQLAAAAVTGFIAKENIVGTLAVCFGISNLINTESLELVGGASVSDVATAFGGGAIAMPAVAALAYLVFNLFTPPCFAAIGAMNSEMKSAKWLWGGIGLQLSVGFTAGFFVYQIGTLVSTGKLGNAFVPGLLAVIGIFGIITALCVKSEREVRLEALKK